MKESDLSLIIKNNVIEQGGWAFKISDPPKSVVTSFIKNPFDMFGLNNRFIFYFEVKLLKSWQAFSFDRIKPHQIEYLMQIKKIANEIEFPVLTTIPLGVWESRKDIYLFCFDITYINNLISNGKKSILKKELLDLKDKAIIIKQKQFDVNELKEKLIV